MLKCSIKEAEDLLEKLQDMEWPAGQSPISVDMPEWASHEEPELEEPQKFAIVFENGYEIFAAALLKSSDWDRLRSEVVEHK